MRRSPLLIATFLAGCVALTTQETIQRGTDPATERDERRELLEDVLRRRDPGVAQDLVARAEHLVAAARAEGSRADSRSGACALDVLEALVAAGPKTGPAILVTLGDRESLVGRWRPGLAVLARHRDPSVAALASARLRG